MGLDRMREMFRQYKEGLGFHPGDVLKPRVNARTVFAEDLVDMAVVVERQSALAPHLYSVVGERIKYTRPSDRFMRFDIDGHEWERVGKL